MLLSYLYYSAAARAVRMNKAQFFGGVDILVIGFEQTLAMLLP